VGRYEAPPWCITGPIFYRHPPARERTYGSLYAVILASDCQPEIVKRLEENFDSATKSMTTALHHGDTSKLRSRNISSEDQCPSSPPPPGPYHPSLRQLHNDFISILCDVCYPFIHDPREIQYIAAARWPGFVQPVLDEHNQRIGRLRWRAGGAGDQPEDMEIDNDDEDEVDEDENLRPPSADTRLRLGRLFKPTLTSALEELYPRITNAAAWAELNSSPPDLDSIPLSRPLSPVKPGGEFGHNVDLTTLTSQTPRRTRSLRSSAPNTPHTPHTPYTPRTPRAASYTHTYAGDRNDSLETGLSALPRLSKFILLAAFLASTNPAKSDIRMFGRGLDEKKRRKRRASSTKAGNGPAKVNPRFDTSPFSNV
jgi:origin recognition complex subunit 5